MSLNYDLTKIENYENVCWVGEGTGRRMNPVTEALIYKMMDVGIGEITRENVAEFASRLSICEAVFGPSLTDGQGGTVALTLEDVQRHVGLRTNVFPKESWAKFLGKVRRYAEREIADQIKRQASQTEQEKLLATG